MEQTKQEQAVQIQTIKIKIGRRELELSIEDAKNLKKVLEDLFGKEVITVDHHHYHDNNWYWPKPYFTQLPYIYCGTAGNGVGQATSEFTYGGSVNGVDYEAKMDASTKVLSINFSSGE